MIPYTWGIFFLGGGEMFLNEMYITVSNPYYYVLIYFERKVLVHQPYIYFFFLISNKSCLYNGLVLKQSIFNFLFVFSYKFYTCMLLFWCQNSINEEKKENISCIVNMQCACICISGKDFPVYDPLVMIKQLLQNWSIYLVDC